MATYYIRPWGNNNNNGTSKESAWRTFAYAIANSVVNDIIDSEGYYNEGVSISSIRKYYGNGKTTFDGIFLGLDGVGAGEFNDCLVKNFIKPSNPIGSTYRNCYIKDASSNGTNSYEYYFDTIFKFNVNFNLLQIGGTRERVRCTFYSENIDNILTITSSVAGTIWTKSYDNIFSNWSIDERLSEFTKYSLFINCKFKFTGGGLGTDETTYEYPTGADDNAKIDNLRSRMVTVYGGVSSDYLEGCKYYSGDETDIFIDPSKENFYLVEGCIAASMNYNGQPIGAKPEGRVINYSDDYTSIVNVDSNGKVIDQTIDGSALGNVLDLGKTRQIINLQALGYRSLRNGVEINPTTNLGSQIAEGINVLTDSESYIVEGEPITLDDAGGTTYDVDDRFMAIDEGGGAGLGFDSASDIGFVRPIIIDKPEAIRIKCSRSSSDLSSIAHINGYITLDLYATPMVNVNSNGEPTYGNMDSGYDEGTAIQLFTRYIQDIPIIKSNQLPA